MLPKFLKNKAIIGLIVLVVLICFYLGYKKFFKKEEAQYILTMVEKGTIVVSVSGSGQISSLEKLDIKPKISGEISSVSIKKGSEVKKGDILFKIDEKNYQKALKDARIALETAELDLQELLKPPDELTLLEAENALLRAKESKEIIEKSLKEAYEEGFNTIANTILALPSFLSIISRLNANQWQSLETYNLSYDKILTQYKQIFEDYKKTNSYSDPEVLGSLLEKTTEIVRSIDLAIKSTDNPAYISQINNYLSELKKVQETIRQYKNNLLNAQRTVEEKSAFLNKLKKGPDALDIRAKEIVIEQKKDNLKTAEENFANCSIYAPFDGIIASLNIKNGETVSPSSVLATLVTKEKMAEISLNEVDASKVKVGQKTILSFDAIPELTLTGKISEIDTTGTLSQGVVSYKIQIILDSDEERIKEGMSVTAEIIVNVKTDILTLPNNAIKLQGDSYYVELVEMPEENKKEYLTKKMAVSLKNPPKKQQVEVGISNDNLTEIVSGLKEGDLVVNTVILKTMNAQNQRNQQLRIPGMEGQIRMR